MPELPDVEVYRQYFETHCLNQKIKNVKVLDERIAPQFPHKEIKNHTFTGVERIGKYLVALLSNGKILSIHFGMTGFLRYSQSETPKYTHFLIQFTNGNYLAFSDRRKLGHVNVFEKKEDLKQIHGLGKDAMEISKREFSDLIKSKSGMVKSALMNQRYLCGIGNIYADEILYQAKIHPKTTCKNLSSEELAKLYNSMKEVLELAIKASANPEKMPEYFFIPIRGKENNCPDRSKVEKTKVGGRTTYFCPSRQKI